VVDIRPNGTLVIEGHAKVTVDEEDWELSLSGIVRSEDIMPNNTVKSEKLAEKQIVRRSSGQGRDGVRRGWLQRVFDKFQPF
jgi:flagellar L-ring protein precursor FlgH